MSGGAGFGLGSLRRNGTAGNGSGGMPSAEVCSQRFLRGRRAARPQFAIGLGLDDRCVEADEASSGACPEEFACDRCRS